MRRVVLLMGSPADLEHSRRIARALEAFGIPVRMHIASAHKTPRELLELLERYEGSGEVGVYVTVAGRSNALSGLVDAAVSAPVIACPPYSDRFGGVDLFSSLRMPSGVAPAVVLEPEGAALLAAKILAVADPALRERVAAHQEAARRRVREAEGRLQAGEL